MRWRGSLRVFICFHFLAETSLYVRVLSLTTDGVNALNEWNRALTRAADPEMIECIPASRSSTPPRYPSVPPPLTNNHTSLSHQYRHFYSNLMHARLEPYLNVNSTSTALTEKMDHSDVATNVSLYMSDSDQALGMQRARNTARARILQLDIDVLPISSESMLRKSHVVRLRRARVHITRMSFFYDASIETPKNHLVALDSICGDQRRMGEGTMCTYIRTFQSSDRYSM